jgi:uncharacterized membrane protein
MNGSDFPLLPPHVEDTVQAIARLHAEHHHQASQADHVVDQLTSMVARPAFLGWFGAFVAIWVAGNLLLPSWGYVPFDPPPFVWLVGFLALLSVFMAILILTSQRRADRLANRRDQLNLEVSILGEQKAAKIIGLLEELRRDSPDVKNRPDQEAVAMSSPAKPQVVLDALEATHREMIDNPEKPEGDAPT